MLKNPLYQRDVISIRDLDLKDIETIMALAKQIKDGKKLNSLKDKIVAQCFFESSTRTRLSFEAASLRLGGQNIGFSNDQNLSIQKGESLQDTIRVIDDYADLIVIRHAKEGASALAAKVAKKPVINAGDGANQHPTQALIDLFSIYECQGKMDNLAIALVGDLKHGRTIHSFTQICTHFNVRLYLVSPDMLALPDHLCDELKTNGVRFSFHQSIAEIIHKLDILYMTRVQQERFSKKEYKLVKDHCILTAELLEKAKSNLKVLHPLPRVNEITIDVDATPHAYYFEQARNGVFVRQALLSLLLNETLS